ncbi:MAG: inositol monophosphatase [Verrucomicrobiota bacterium]|nr:inositol monophosphatase [Verrucomicrobiota bacterium]
MGRRQLRPPCRSNHRWNPRPFRRPKRRSLLRRHLRRHEARHPPALLQCAIAAAKAAGAHAFRNTHRRLETFREDRHDVKLELDRECQRAAEAAYPRHDVLGEESEQSAARPRSEFQWIIDPIDGTVNYHHGLRYWAASVAARRRREVVAGAVCAPALDELYQASVGAPALPNGKRIRISRVKSLAGAVVLTGMDKNLTSGSPPLTLFSRVALRAQKARILGSAALDLCQVARGAADGYIETGIYLWDVAATGLIVRQAGGRAETLWSDKAGYALACFASNGRIHAEPRKLSGACPITFSPAF